MRISPVLKDGEDPAVAQLGADARAWLAQTREKQRQALPTCECACAVTGV